MRLLWLEAVDFRVHAGVRFTPAAGLTVVRGPNGAGKTSLLEAAGYLASLASFRGASASDMVRLGAATATLRGEFVARDRKLLVEASLPAGPGRVRAQLNRNRPARAGELREHLQVLVFQPDDLDMIKGPPAGRRAALDEAVVALRPRLAELRNRLSTCLRQRNALLRQAWSARASGDSGASAASVAGRTGEGRSGAGATGAGTRAVGSGESTGVPGRASRPRRRAGDLDESFLRTLDVWDDRLVAAGEEWAGHRRRVLAELAPRVEGFVARLADGAAGPVSLHYEASWSADGLASALVGARAEDLQRGVTSVGPHRDDVVVRLGGMAARTHASQGNQRALALAFRLALHEALTEAAGEPPLLFLDDVFSELDPARARRLLGLLPPGQIILATAGEIPAGANPEQVVFVEDLPPVHAASKETSQD